MKVGARLRAGMNPYLAVALWAALAVAPALLLWHRLRLRGEETFPWVFLTFLFGPVGIAGWAANLLARRLVPAP